MDHKDVIIQELRAKNKKLTEELEKLKSQPAAVNTDMERLTKRDKHGFAHYPYCYEKCDGDGIGIRCQTCDFEEKICNKLADYEDLEERGLLLKLPCKKDELINVLAKKLLSTEFGNCYMCTNPMKNITLDGINNGCDGMCNASDSATVDDFLKKIIREIEAQAALEKIIKEGGVK